MKRVLFFFVICLSCNGYAQSNWQRFKQLLPAQKTWVILHPFKAKKAYKISLEATNVSDSIAKTHLLDGDVTGGQVDAFRHAYWMARLNQEIGKSAARSLGKAHEKDNYRQFKDQLLEDGVFPDKISSEMDLINNNVGLNYTKKRKPYPKDGLIYRIVNEILAGELRILKKDKEGNYMSCTGKILDSEELKNNWTNNKCLVPSNVSLK
uniref:DUF6973 domain-containing protein n=1 Tax=Polaribacter sp. TaxID=1920175 RepID=UPI00404754B3